MKHGFLRLLFVFWLFGACLTFARPISARIVCEGPGDPDCAVGNECSLCGVMPGNICCDGTGKPECAGKAIWTYAHSPQCIVDNTSLTQVDCSFHWEYQQCSAVDSCKGQTGLRPGLCNAGGCAISSTIYKTCCNPGGWAETCNGGDYSGTCPNTTVFGSGSSADCVGSGTPAPTGGAGCTPCNWCTNQTDCNNVGWSWTSGGCCAVPGDGCCDPSNPPGGCGAGDEVCYNGGQCCRSAESVANGTCTCSGQQCTDCCVPWVLENNKECVDPGRPGSLTGFDANCAERFGPDEICCVAPGTSDTCWKDPAAKVVGYITVDGIGRAGPAVLPGKNNGVCTSGATKTCGAGPNNGTHTGDCGSDYIGACGNPCSSLSTSASVYRDAGISPSWTCSHYIAETGAACWEIDPTFFCRAPNTDGLGFTFNSLVSSSTNGIYTFTLSPPAGYICTSATFKKINTSGVTTHIQQLPGCSITNNVALYANLGGGSNIVVFDMPSPPKTCSVSTSSVIYPTPAVISFSGNAYSGTAEPVRLWVEQWSTGSEIAPSPAARQISNGINYYQVSSCTSTNGALCSSSTSLNLPPGNYYTHCDLPTDPKKCSGNPYCSYEGVGGANDCTTAGWVSCSTSDKVPFTVLYPPIHIQGNYQEDLGNPTSVCSSPFNPSLANLFINFTPQYASSGFRYNCTKNTADYACDVIFDNSIDPAIDPSQNITLNVSYSNGGYNSIDWRNPNACAGVITNTIPVDASAPAPIPTITKDMFFKYGAGSWFKLSNASFNNDQPFRTNNIPQYMTTYDSEDTTDKYVIIREAGAILSNSSFNPGLNATGLTFRTPNDWKNDSYIISNLTNPVYFVDYAKSRKDYVSSDLDGLQANKINIYNAGSLTINAADVNKITSKAPLILIVEGDITFDTNFNTYIPPATPPNSVIFIATGSVNFTSAATEVNGVIIGNNVNISAIAVDNGLKIRGNLISSNTLTNNRSRLNNTKPSLFVIFDPKPYADLFPYLSVAKYNYQPL